eukprot:gene12992-8839_t
MVHPYLWIAIVGGFVAFLTGAGVGMNDLSNAFGTTYGAKILTLLQIVILASICEFAGSVSLGGSVTSTISGGIADSEAFAQEPYVLMYGMLCALGAAFVWLAVATWLILPVSSTHSICGGVIGFGIVYGGPNGIFWAKKKDEFPFVDGVVPIVASWFISPVLTGAVAASMYTIIRKFVLQPANSKQRALYSLPVVVCIAFFFESFFVLYKGAKSRLHWSVGKAAWVAVIIAVGAGIVTAALLPLLKRHIDKREAAEEVRRNEEPAHPDAVEPEGIARELNNDPVRKEGETTGAVVNPNVSDSDSDAEEGEAVPQPHQAAIYSKSTESIYRYLQVFTAICASFAHGASDVSNAVGPFAAIFNIYQNGKVSAQAETPIWILCLGGAGLVVGLATFGVRLMSLMGEKITLITPSRGFAAELSGALVVSFASGYGIPVSSTHCITGAVVAISMIDLGFTNVKWMMVLKMYCGWVGTLIVTGLVSATFFAQGIYSPSRS